jgi:hypothetical protein
LIIGLAFLAGACSDDDDEGGSTQQGAESQLCSDIADLEKAIAKVEDLSTSSTVDEARQARADVKTALDKVSVSARSAGDAKVDELVNAFNDLQATIDGLSSGQTLSQAASAIESDVEAIAQAREDLHTQQKCPS